MGETHLPVLDFFALPVIRHGSHFQNAGTFFKSVLPQLLQIFLNVGSDSRFLVCPIISGASSCISFAFAIISVLASIIAWFVWTKFFSSWATPRVSHRFPPRHRRDAGAVGGPVAPLP